MPQRNPRSHTNLVMFLLLLAVFLTVNFIMVSQFILAVLMGYILAIALRPLHRRLRRRFHPVVSSLLLTTGLAVIVILPLSFFGWMAIKQALDYLKHLSQVENLSFENLLDRISEWEWLENLFGSSDEVLEGLRSKIQTGGEELSKWLLAILGSLPDKTVKLVLSLVACFYFLIDSERFKKYLSQIIPINKDVQKKISVSFRETSFSVFVATFLAAAAQAAIMGIAFLVLGVNGFFLAVVITFILAWIPILGSLPVWGIATFLLLKDHHTTKAIFMVLFGLVCGISDNIVRSWVLKGKNGIHTLVSLVAIFGGIETFGVFGVFYGPILAALLLTLLNVWPSIAKDSHLFRPSID